MFARMTTCSVAAVMLVASAIIVSELRPSVQLQAQALPVWGFADLHNHQFANLAFGGRMVFGNAYGPLDQLSAAADRQMHGNLHFWSDPDTFKTDVMGGYLVGAGGPLNYANDGFPSFSGWPAFFEVSHQKVHEEWLYRAVQGGMRLMVMMAVEGPPLCEKVDTDGRNCADEMGPINMQLDAAYAMQAYIDGKSGGTGKGWYRIVTSPQEARSVIQQGKLAVVLGVETAHLFHCKSEPCNWQGPLTALWDKGVRHFFPIHQDDNAFGGASYFKPIIQSDWFSPYKLNTHTCASDVRNSCNDLGLTVTGREFIERLMQIGAIVDVDHMSDRSFADTLAIATARQHPVVASHAGFNEINRGDQNHEGQLTALELQQIRDVGGMVGLITHQGKLDQVVTYQPQAGRQIVWHTKGGTTETFAQAYYYALERAPGVSIGLGSDFNGFLRQVGPRFGKYMCDHGCDWSKPTSALRTTSRQVSGTRVFDFNVDGLAQVGLLPDMLKDLRTLGISAADLDPLNRSADAYVRMWERSHAARRADSEGFEDGRSGWSLYAPVAGFSASVVASPARTGTASLATSGTAGIAYQDFAGLVPGNVYRVTGWVRSTAGATTKAALSLHNTGGANVGTVTTAPSSTWQPLTLLYTADSTAAVRVHLNRSAGTGTIYWDDVTVRDVTPGRVEQLWYSTSTRRWEHQDLTAVSVGAKVAADSDFTSFVKADQSEHLVYVGVDRRVRQIFYNGSRWQDQDLSGLSGTTARVAPGSSLNSYVAASQGEHVIYVGTDRHIYKLSYSPATNQWQNVNMTAGFAVTAAASSGLTSFVKDDNSEHVFYVGTDGHVYQLLYSPAVGRWVNQDLTAAFGSGVLAATGSALASFIKADQSEHVFYIGADQRVYQLVYSGSRWVNQSLTALSIATALPAAGTALTGFVSSNQNEHVFYVGTDRRVHQLIYSVGAGRWFDQDLTGAAAGRLVSPGADLTSFVKVAQSEHVFYTGEDGHERQLVYVPAGAWVDQDLSFAAGGTELSPGPATSFVKADQSEHVMTLARP
jgi:microsomal dipeptidase-like Zn-dependent dipeptidase